MVLTSCDAKKGGVNGEAVGFHICITFSSEDLAQTCTETNVLYMIFLKHTFFIKI